jgi:hypothetical protein
MADMGPRRLPNKKKKSYYCCDFRKQIPIANTALMFPQKSIDETAQLNERRARRTSAMVDALDLPVSVSIAPSALPRAAPPPSALTLSSSSVESKKMPHKNMFSFKRLVDRVAEAREDLMDSLGHSIDKLKEVRARPRAFICVSWNYSDGVFGELQLRDRLTGSPEREPTGDGQAGAVGDGGRVRGRGRGGGRAGPGRRGTR